MSPTQRTLQLLRDEGHTAQVVEKWIPQCKRRVDLFGIIDVLVMDDRLPGLLGIQATSGANHAARRTKSLAEPKLRDWLCRGLRFEIWSFAKRIVRNKDGKNAKRKLWELRRDPITLADLPAESEPAGAGEEG